MKKQKNIEARPKDDLDIFDEFEEEKENAAEELPEEEILEEEAPVKEDENMPEFNEPEITDEISEKTLLHKKPEKSKEEDDDIVPHTLAEDIADMAPDVPVNLVAVIGKTTTNIGDLIKCRVGEVIDLGRTPGETVDLVANGRLIARGELVEMDGKLGVKILKMVR